MYCLEELVQKFQRARLVAFLGSTPELDRDTRALVWSFQRNEWRVDEDPLPLVDRIRVIIETDYGMDEEEFWELCERYQNEGPDFEDGVRLDAIQNLYDLIEDDFRFRFPGVIVAYLNDLCFREHYSQYPDISRGMAISLEHTAKEFAKYVNPELYREYLEEPDSSGDSEDDDSNGDIRRQMINDYLNDLWGGGGHWGLDICTSPESVGYLIPCTLSLLGYGDDEKNMESIMGLKKDEFLSAFRDVVTKVWLPEVIRRLTEYRD
jgi:hypothetical protein